MYPQNTTKMVNSYLEKWNVTIKNRVNHFHLHLLFRLIFTCSVDQSYPTFCNPMDCSPPHSSVHGISQARILEWVVLPSSRGYFQPKDWTCISCLSRRFFTTEPWLGVVGRGRGIIALFHLVAHIFISLSRVWTSWQKSIQSVVLEKNSWESLGLEGYQSILEEINPEYSLEGLMLKLQLQYFGHLMRRANTWEKTLMLGKTEGRRSGDRGWDGWMASPTQWTCVWATLLDIERQIVTCCSPWGHKELDMT